MPIGIKLVQATQKETAMKRPFPLCVEASEPLPKGGEVRAEAKIADNDRFSHLASEVKISVEGVKTRTGAEAKARRFCERATYLTESLQFVETDVGGTAIARSSPETMAGKRAPFYEAAVRADEVTLRRFKPRERGPGREQIPFCVTEETLARLVDDAAGTLTK